jgi:hypothetical protein
MGAHPYLCVLGDGKKSVDIDVVDFSGGRKDPFDRPDVVHIPRRFSTLTGMNDDECINLAIFVIVVRVEVDGRFAGGKSVSRKVLHVWRGVTGPVLAILGEMISKLCKIIA